MEEMFWFFKLWVSLCGYNRVRSIEVDISLRGNGNVVKKDVGGFYKDLDLYFEWNMKLLELYLNGIF